MLGSGTFEIVSDNIVPSVLKMSLPIDSNFVPVWEIWISVLLLSLEVVL